jgi:hypothetical protein
MKMRMVSVGRTVTVTSSALAPKTDPRATSDLATH